VNKAKQAAMDTELATYEISVRPETKLALAHLKLNEVITALDPASRGKKLRNGFRKLQIEAEALSTVTLAMDKLSDEILRDIYRLIDLITVELGSSSMMEETIREVHQELLDAGEIVHTTQKGDG